MPTVLVPREIVAGETRVAATPDTVKRMVRDGFSVAVESGAGSGASISDAAFQKVGAQIGSDLAALYKEADLVVKIHPPQFHEGLGGYEADFLKEGSVLVSFLWPTANPGTVKALTDRKVTAFAMERIPRITRAQAMDALSSQANIAGYKAVLVAAEKLPKLFPMLMTAAGTIRPARVVIMGAGVAGLQAVATAKRLGAIVEVSDVRPAVKEQVESLGGRFIEVPTDASMQDSGGYAKEASQEFLKKQRELVRTHIVKADVVITTALVPGAAAPLLVTEDMVREMRDGSVIVDLAVEQGGNCELSEAGQVVVKEGVTIIGAGNLPATVPFHASEMYAKNILNVVRHLYKKAEWNLDLTDEINEAAIVTHEGQVRLEE